jgi:F-type H+-transporting ATPase subunit b
LEEGDFLDFLLVLSSMPDERLFGMDSQTVLQAVANLINVGVLAALLAFLLYRPIREILRKRSDRIQGQLAHAEEEMEKATELRQLYERKMEDVDREREDILGEARKQAAETGRRLVTDAKKEADAVRERAAHNVEMEWERAQAEMRTAIIDVSAIMAEKFVSLAINKETHDRLFDESMADLEGMTWRG